MGICKYHFIKRIPAITDLKALLPAVFLLFCSCAGDPPYPGFSSSGTGFHYRLIRIGESEAKASPGDYISASLEYRTMEDSVFFSALRRFRLAEPSFAGSVEECFMMLSKGDSAEFIISAKDFFNITIEAPVPSFIGEDAKMIIAAGIKDIRSEKEYLEEMETFIRHLMNHSSVDIDKSFEKLAETEAMDPGTGSPGILYYHLREGYGEKIKRGDTVIIHYEGKFEDGRIFDSTRKRDEPFEYIYGHEGQLIKGLEEVVKMMREGGKALVYIPPELAFGEKGSSTGIIPPSTPLLFEVEILKVQ